MRDFNPNPTSAVSPEFSGAPRHEGQSPALVEGDAALISRMWVNLPPRIRPDPANRHDPRPPAPGLSLPFNGTPQRAADIVGWAAAPGIVGASLDSAADGSVECVLWIRTPGGTGETVPHGKCLSRGSDGIFSVVADAQGDALLVELRRLCEGVDPFASPVQAAPRPSTRDT